MKYNDKILDLFTNYCKKNNSIDIYDDYRDHENPEYLLYKQEYIKTPCNNNIIKKIKIDYDDFICNIIDAYSESCSYYIDAFIDGFISDLSGRYKEYALNNYDDLLSDMRDIFYDYVDIKYPIDSFLNDTIKINIFWDAKNQSGYDDSFLVWLLHTQHILLKDHKYLKKLLNNLHSYMALYDKLSSKDRKQLEEDYKNNIFLKSLIDEIHNCYLDSPRDLCFIASVSIKDYFYLIQENKRFTIKKDAMCGLVDKYNGGGSILEIQLLNDIVVNTNDISIKVEGIDRYTVNDIYGLCGSCYKEVVVC